MPDTAHKNKDQRPSLLYNLTTTTTTTTITTTTTTTTTTTNAPTK
jgi:hypothetical protein